MVGGLSCSVKHGESSRFFSQWQRLRWPLENGQELHVPYISTLLMRDYLTCLSRKSTGVNKKMNGAWILFICISFRVTVLSWLTGTLSNTCAFIVTSNCLLWKRFIALVLLLYKSNIKKERNLSVMQRRWLCHLGYIDQFLYQNLAEASFIH